MTDKHDIVGTAIEVLEQAAAALRENNQYNSEEITYPDYYPNGIYDAVKCLVEPFTRTHVCGKMSQARDCAGYAALMVSWVRAGMPESQFAPIMVQFYPKFYKMLKEMDRIDGSNLGNPDWDTKPEKWQDQDEEVA